jgi:hypothetical protein
MNYYKHQFLQYLKVMEIQEERKINMKGGVIKRVRVGQHNIEYDLHINASGWGKKKTLDLMAISTSKANNKQPCFIMKITPGGDSSLTSISRGFTCFLDNKDDTTGIVLAALEIAKLNGAVTFEFTDNSTKSVDGRKIKLSDLSFLTTGQTWYERVLPNIHPVDKSVREMLEIHRNTVQKNKWIDVYNNLLSNFNIDANFDITEIDITKEGSAMKILNRAKKSKNYTEFFDIGMLKLIQSSNVMDLHGIHWIMDII